MSRAAVLNAGAARWLPVLDILALVAIVVASVVLKFAFLEPVGPVIFFDEMLYGLASRAMAGEIPYPGGHYPFIYPLFLAPSVLVGAGYDGLFLSNVLASSALPVACWLLARTVGARLGFPVAACAALLPFNFTFPTQVMAENLFVPMFAFAAWYAVRGRVDGRLASLAYGAGLAALFLTKYLALPAAPLLALVWLYGARCEGVARGRVAGAAVLAAAGAAILVAAWLVVAARSGIGVREAFGGGVSDFRDSSLITPDSLALWSSVYIATLVLACGPSLCKLVEQCLLLLRRPLAYAGDGPYSRLVVLTLLLAGGYVLVCIHHSASLAMNYPVPQRVVARYFMHLTPLVVVIGVCGIAQGVGRRSGAIVGIVAAAISGLGLWLAWEVLYGEDIWTLPPWFAAIPLYASDIMGYRQDDVLSTSIILGVLGLLMARIPIVRWLYPVAIAVILIVGGIYVGETARKETAYRPLHARALAPHVIRDIEAGRRVLVIVRIPRMPPGDIRQGLIFWGADPKMLEVVGGEQRSGFPPDIDSAYRLTTQRLDGAQPIDSYRVGMRQGLIYSIPPERLRTREEQPVFPDAPVTVALQPPCRGRDVATITWDFGGTGVSSVGIHVVSGGGERLFALQGAAGSEDTGSWVGPDTILRFRDPASGRLLAEARPDRALCPSQ